MGIFDKIFGGKKTTPLLKKQIIVVENKEKLKTPKFFELKLNTINEEEITQELSNAIEWIIQLSKNLEKDKNEY